MIILLGRLALVVIRNLHTRCALKQDVRCVGRRRFLWNAATTDSTRFVC
jgi:hypothetical protein